MTKPAKPKRHRHLPALSFGDTITGFTAWCECGAIYYRRSVTAYPKWRRPKKETAR